LISIYADAVEETCGIDKVHKNIKYIEMIIKYDTSRAGIGPYIR